MHPNSSMVPVHTLDNANHKNSCTQYKERYGVITSYSYTTDIATFKIFDAQFKIIFSRWADILTYSDKANFRFIAVWWRDFKRSEVHTSELQSRFDLVCRLLLEKKNR